MHIKTSYYNDKITQTWFINFRVILELYDIPPNAYFHVTSVSISNHSVCAFLVICYHVYLCVHPCLQQSKAMSVLQLQSNMGSKHKHNIIGQ